VNLEWPDRQRRRGTPSLSLDSAAQQASFTALTSAASWPSGPAGTNARTSEGSWYVLNGKAYKYGDKLDFAAEQKLVLDTSPGGLAGGTRTCSRSSSPPARRHSAPSRRTPPRARVPSRAWRPL